MLLSQHYRLDCCVSLCCRVSQSFHLIVVNLCWMLGQYKVMDRKYLYLFYFILAYSIVTKYKYFCLTAGYCLIVSDDASQKLRDSLHRKDLVTPFIRLSQHLLFINKGRITKTNCPVHHSSLSCLFGH